MDQKLWLEMVGYVASVLVAISLMMSNIVRLRVINLVGSLAFTIYGAMIGAIPVAAVNGFICVINVFYLVKMSRTRAYFRILRTEPDSEYLRYFLGFYQADIHRSQPEFRYAPHPGLLTFYVLRDLVPAGVFIGELGGDGTLHVLLDFVIPAYRDLKVGRYLFRERGDFFREQGVRQIVSPAGNAEHARYLRRMGFTPADPRDPDGLYRCTLG